MAAAPVDHEPLLAAVSAAVTEVAGEVVARHAGHPAAVATERKGVGDFVTEVDIAAERRLRALLLDAFPEHGFLGEESAPTRLDADCVWVVDPIDGTSNFAAGLTPYAVSAACMVAGRPLVGAVWCEPDGCLWTAARGHGAYRDGTRVRTPAARLDDATMIGVQWHRGEHPAAMLRALCESGARVRTFGSTVTQLCDVALGRLHANVQRQGRLWDFAAAGLIVEEAGGRFTDFAGGSVFPIGDLRSDRHYPSLGAPEPIHAALLARIGGT